MIDDARPDPDALLARVNAEAEGASRGKLKIFFGASAGVGKTYAMLAAAARAAVASGRAVLVAAVETHGRADTERWQAACCGCLRAWSSIAAAR